MYYFDDGVKLESKVKALEHKVKTNLEPKFYYYDEIYDNVNWRLEPPQSLDYYYVQQAQRIRDEYDYVILCYSGGYDSTNILETFHFNNIKLDKIITVGALNQDSSSMVDENHNGELYHNVFPYIQELGLSSITQAIDYTDYFNNVNQFSISHYSNEWIDHTGGWFSPHHWFWHDIEKYIIPQQYRDKKVALIFGKDKPYIAIENRKFGFRFKDIAINGYGNDSSTANCDRINFYWDPKAPEILVKQLHVLLRAFIISKYDHGYEFNMGHDLIGGKSTNEIVYNLRKPILYKSPKSKTRILSLRDQYLLGKKNSDVYRMYESGIQLLHKRLPVHEHNTPINSKFYSII